MYRSKKLHSLFDENNQNPNGIAEEKISGFEERYDAIVETATREYENEPPSDYYRDGYNLYLRMIKYKHNHLLFLTNPMVPSNNNLCERKARVLKGKINQAVSLRSFEHLAYFCECLSILDHFATDNQNNLYEAVKEIFQRKKQPNVKTEITEQNRTESTEPIVG